MIIIEIFFVNWFVVLVLLVVDGEFEIFEEMGEEGDEDEDFNEDFEEFFIFIFIFIESDLEFIFLEGILVGLIFDCDEGGYFI